MDLRQKIMVDKSMGTAVRGGRIGLYSGEGGISSTLHPQLPPPNLLWRRSRSRRMRMTMIGEIGRRTAPRLFVAQGITGMGEAEALEKSWLAGRSGCMGKTTNYGGGFYVD